MQNGYKRKVRVLFVASGSLRRALAAAEIAAASGWMEARAHCFPPMIAAGAPHAQESSWAWPDLVVALDESACLALPRLQSGVQVKCYAVPEFGLVDWPATRAQLEDIVKGMAGGLAMMQRAAAE